MRLLIPLLSVARTSEVRYAHNLARALTDRGWSVTVYTRDAREVDSLFDADAIDIRHIPFQSMLDWESIRALSRDLKEEGRGAVVLTQSFGVAYAAVVARRLARRKDIRVVLTIHHSKMPPSNIFWRMVIKEIDTIFFSSMVVRNAFKEAWRRLPIAAEHLHVVRNSLYTPPQPFDKEPKGPVIATFYGSIVAKNGLETLLDALPQLKGKRIRLCIVGKGNPDYIDSLRRRAINAGTMDMITWKIGTNESVTHILSQSHFGVFPYTSPDSFGFHNLEFMAAGLPQIANASPVAMEYCGPQGGAMFVKGGDKDLLAEAILTLAASPELRRKMGTQAAARYAANMPFSNFIEKTIMYLIK